MKPLSKLEEAHLLGIRHYFIGQIMPAKYHGDAGRYNEMLYQQMGYHVNKGLGPDLPLLGWEAKCRDVNSTSALTVTALHPNHIIQYPYKFSYLYAKCQKIILTTTADCVVKDVQLLNLTSNYTQTKIEEAYEHGRKQLTKNPESLYTNYTGYYGYFENTKKGRPELDFRLTWSDCLDLQTMSNPLVESLFDWN